MDLNKLFAHSLSSAAPNVGLSWVWADQTDDGRATFSSYVDISSTLSSQYLGGALLRAFSMFLVSKLNEESLKDAVESLTEIYQWQLDAENVRLVEPKVHHLGTYKPKLVEREPFSIER